MTPEKLKRVADAAEAATLAARFQAPELPREMMITFDPRGPTLRIAPDEMSALMTWVSQTLLAARMLDLRAAMDDLDRP